MELLERESKSEEEFSFEVEERKGDDRETLGAMQQDMEEAGK